MSTATKADLKSRFQFFRDNCGAVHRSFRTGMEMARTEILAEQIGIEFVWEPETDVDDSWMDEKERAEDHVVECAWAKLEGSTKSECLGNIFDATDDYRRFVNCELAAQLIANIGYDFPEPGCYADECRGLIGQYKTVAGLAESYGWDIAEFEKEIDNDESTIIDEIVDEAIEYLNRLETRDGHSWGFDGDFFLHGPDEESNDDSEE